MLICTGFENKEERIKEKKERAKKMLILYLYTFKTNRKFSCTLICMKLLRVLIGTIDYFASFGK